MRVTETTYSVELTKTEIYQLEEWCGKHCEEIIFDSNKDDWSTTSKLKKKIK